MLYAAHPGRAALYAHAEARVLNRAVTAQVQVPVEGLFRQTVLFYLLLQELKRSGALAAAYDFAVAFGREHIAAQRQFRPLGVARHVEGFDGRRVMMNHDRLVEL